MPAPYIPDIWLETCGRYDLYEMLDSLWWLDACVWPDSNESWTCGRCSGVMWPMNCFGRSRCHLIYTTQEIRDHRTGQPINQQVWKPETHTNCSSPLSSIYHLKRPILSSVDLLNTWFNSTPTQSVLIVTVPLHLLWSWIHNCFPDACPIHSRYLTGNLWKIQLVWNIGFLMVAGCLCMTGFQWKLNLWKV